MKKLLAVMLCVVMLLSVIPSAGFSAYDMPIVDPLEFGDYSSIFLDDSENIHLYEDDAYVRLMFYPEESGKYRIYSNSYEDTFVRCYNEYGEEIAYDDDGGIDNNFSCIVELQAEKLYYFEVSAYFEYDAYFVVGLTKLSAEGMIEMELSQSYSASSETMDSQYEYFSFTPKDSGYYAFYCENNDYEEENPHAYLYDSQWNLIDKDDDSGEGRNFSLSAYLEKDKTYYLEVSEVFYVIDFGYSISVKKTEVIVDTEIVEYPTKMTYYEGFVEDMIDYSGLKLKFTYSDGTTLNWEYDEEIIGTTVELAPYAYENGGYYVYILAGFSCNQFDLNVVENPVESIELYSMTEIELYENISGYRDYGRFSDEFDFIYRYKMPEDTLMKINYKDGSEKIASIFDEVDDRKFTYYDKQLKNNKANEVWSFGKNPIYVEYYGAETIIYANVVENPVEKLTLNSAPTREYVYGRGAYGGVVEGKYHFRPDDLTGLSFTVHFKDGTTKVLTYEDVQNELTLDGYRYDVEWMSITRGGTYEVTFTYMEKELKYDVFVYDKIEPRGDVNMDGKVTIVDATMMQQYLADLINLNEAQIYTCDLDGHGDVTVMDATRLQRHVAKIEAIL